MRDDTSNVVAGTGCLQLGLASGEPAFYCHGFPGSRLEARLLDDAARAEGIRLIALDRPGMGLTPPTPSFAVDQWPGRVAAVADALGMGQFSLLGVSGGAPYALACAAALAPRVSSVVLGCPAVPYAYLRGHVGFPFRQMDAVYERAPGVLRWAMRAFSVPGRRWPSWLVLPPPPGSCPPADRRLFQRPDVPPIMAASIRASWRNGGDVVFAEGERLRGYGGVELSAVRCPLVVLHGREDQVIPLGCVERWCGDHAHVTLKVYDGEGHFSLAFARSRELLRALRAENGSTMTEDAGSA